MTVSQFHLDRKVVASYPVGAGGPLSSLETEAELIVSGLVQ